MKRTVISATFDDYRNDSRYLEESISPFGRVVCDVSVARADDALPSFRSWVTVTEYGD